MQRKIAIVTATRAEYGILKSLISEIANDSDLTLQLIVTGTHLSPEFGFTIEEIREEGFPIVKQIEMLLSSDSPIGVSKSMGLAQISFAEAFAELQPDILVVLGDRFELIPIVTSANIARIPVAHISGGETTQGALDELFRHAITKLSQLHFTAIDTYAKRVIQMGEEPTRVFSVGEPGLEKIASMNLLSKFELETSLGVSLKVKNLLVTYHPETYESIYFSVKSFNALLNVLNGLHDTLIIFTKANADAGGRAINSLIDKFVYDNSEKAVAFDSLGKLRYLSALQFVDGVIGNSSSGIIEVASFKKGTINIGNRQKGRIRPNSVIDVAATESDIKAAIEKLYSEEFSEKLRQVENPYFQQDTSKKIKETLKTFNLAQLSIKPFHDIDL